MPFTLTHLSPEETEEKFTRVPRKTDLSEYVGQLRNLGIGGPAARVDFDSNETRKAHIGRFNRAAKELGITLKWVYPTDKSDKTHVWLRAVGETSSENTDTASSQEDANEPSESAPRSRSHRRAAEPVAA